MKLCKDCINKGKKENCKIYTSMSNFAEKCKDLSKQKGASLRRGNMRMGFLKE